MCSEPKPNDDAAPRPRRGRSLAFRLNAWYVVVFIGSIAALALFAIPTIRDALDRSDAIVLEERVEHHVAVLSGGLRGYQTAVESSAALGEPAPPVRVRDATGRTIYERGKVGDARFVAARMTGTLRLDLGSPTSPWPSVIERLRPGAIALIAGALLLAVAGGFALTRRGLRPVRELAATARDVIRSGDLSRRVPEHGTGDELDEVSELFNRMLARNQAVVVAMREAIDNVAHDLRTPLTRVRGTAEVALRSDDAAAAREALAVCIEESDHLLVMLRTIMEVSEAEAGLLQLERAPTSLGTLAAEVVELYEQVAEDAGIELAITQDSKVVVDADPARMRQAIANLVDNAIKYTPRGGKVEIEVSRERDVAIVRIRDTGEGIPEVAIPRIFERLYRAEPSRNKPGLGLGLSIVKAIVVAHGGTVTVESSPGKGSTFTVEVPVASPQPRFV